MIRAQQHAKAIQEATKILRKQTGRDDLSFQGFERSLYDIPA